jgi:hypothetical protein
MSECAEGENQEGCKVNNMNAFPIPNAVTGPYINHSFFPAEIYPVRIRRGFHRGREAHGSLSIFQYSLTQ